MASKNFLPKTTPLVSFLFVSVLLSCIFFPATAQRYQAHSFDSVSRIDDITYRIVGNEADGYDTLAFDLYSPADDHETSRPLIIFIHGGSFITGSRKDDLVRDFCTDMAQRGYVAAALSYRLGNMNDILSGELTLPTLAYHAVQDSRAAVRFFRANSAAYGIDTSMIISGGYSAGAITALLHAYLDSRSASKILPTAQLGPLESGDHLELPSRISAVVNYCGAVNDTLWMENADVPVISFHGTADATVPYDNGHAFGIQLYPILYGSGSIHRILERRGITNELFTAEDEGHELSQETVVSSLPETARFLSTLYTESSTIDSWGKAHISYRREIRKEKRMFLHAKNNLMGQVYDLRGRRRTNIPSGRSSAAGIYLVKDAAENNPRF